MLKEFIEKELTVLRYSTYGGGISKNIHHFLKEITIDKLIWASVYVENKLFLKFGLFLKIGLEHIGGLCFIMLQIATRIISSPDSCTSIYF